MELIKVNKKKSKGVKMRGQLNNEETGHSGWPKEIVLEHCRF